MGTTTSAQPSELYFSGPIFDRPVSGARIRITAGSPAAGLELVSPPMNATTTATGVAAGSSHVCMTAPTNTFCWGRGLSGQLGGPTEPLTHGYPAPVINGAGLSGLTAANDFSCGLAAGGLAHCWGGRFGDGQGATSIYGAGAEIPFTKIAARNDWLCGLTSAGEVWCLGDNAAGLGDGVSTSSTEFVKVLDSGTPGYEFTQLDVGRDHACALNAAGEAWCWGAGIYGQLGDSTNTDRATPALVSGSGTGARVFTKLAAGHQHTCAIASTGSVWCWGDNAFGQLGGSVPPLLRVPQLILSGPSGVQNFTSIAAGAYHTCGVNEAAIWCWGRNDDGQLGHGTFVNSAVQRQVPGLGPPTAFALGDRSSCVQGGPTVYCWGANDSRQLGQGAMGPIVQPLPVRVMH
jgi:alpha-tubulin suppressor-like RCC1 family protein